MAETRGRRKGGEKSGGRQKSTPNKRSLELLKGLLAHDCVPAGQMAELLMSKDLHAAEKMACWEKLLPYLFPQRKPVDAEGYVTLEQAAGMLGAQAQRFRTLLEGAISDPVTIALILEGLRASKQRSTEQGV